MLDILETLFSMSAVGVIFAAFLVGVFIIGLGSK